MAYTIIDYDHYGRGITKKDNKLIFVNNAIIGEEVEIDIYNNKKTYSEANVTKYYKTSDKRCGNICKYYDK